MTDQSVEKLLFGYTFNGEGLIDTSKLLALSAAFTDRTRLTLDATNNSGELHYTWDGADPTAASPKYAGPLNVNETGTLKARWFDAAGKPAGPVYSRKFLQLPLVPHAAVGAAVTYKPEFPGYAGPGPQGLTDG